MGLTAYHFDRKRQMIRPMRQIVELIHSEADGGLTAEIPSWHQIHAGDYIGLKCVDERFRLFEVGTADLLDDSGTLEITARDAAREELAGTVIETAAIKNKSVAEAITALLDGTGWGIGVATGSGTVGEVEDVSFETAESAMERIAGTAKVELVPYYTFADNAISGKKIDILPQEPVYRGRIISAKNASEIVLTEEGTPKTRVYPLGAYVTGTGKERKRLTIGDVVWDTAKGDPASKPKGQKWIELPGVDGIPPHSYIYEDNYESDAEKLINAAWDDLQEKKAAETSGKATAADISFLPGYSHAAVRVNDNVALQTESGEKRLERISNIQRHYVRKDRTTLEFGKRTEKNWLTKKLEDASNNARRAGGGVSRLQAEAEDLGAELYRATESIVELEGELTTQLNEVWIDLDSVNATLELKANSTAVNEIASRISTAEVKIDGLNATLELKANSTAVNEIASRISTAEVKIDGLDASVTLQASRIESVGSRVEEAAAELTVQAGLISTKVSRDGVISAINQTPESITISAGKINLSGYVTASQLAATNASISNITSGMTTATVLKAMLFTGNTVNVTSIVADVFNFGDKALSRRSMTVSTPEGEKILYYVGYMP